MSRLTTAELFTKFSNEILPNMSKEDLLKEVFNFFDSNLLEDFTEQMFIDRDLEFNNE